MFATLSRFMGISRTRENTIIADILIRSENDLAQFAAAAKSMNGAFFLVSGFWSLASWPDGAKPFSDRQTQWSGKQDLGSGSLNCEKYR
ncbi:MAG: hypothetical protein J0M04_23960 [Verrucomicrobia bacterium]|nr:hypothetical protein [Verrucomicrobiota bacterium]